VSVFLAKIIETQRVGVCGNEKKYLKSKEDSPRENQNSEHSP
jgi:hypothetical protein